jgi:hypothetical protein
MCCVHTRHFFVCCVLITNKMHQLKYNTTGHKVHFISGANATYFGTNVPSSGSFINNKISHVQQLFLAVFTLTSTIKVKSLKMWTAKKYKQLWLCNSGGCCCCSVYRYCWTVFCSFNIVRLYDGIEGEWLLTYLLDLRNFVADKQPDDDTLVPKYVAVGTWYEVCFMNRFAVLVGAFCWGLKI